MVFDRAQKADAHFFDVLRLQGHHVARRPVVLHLLLIKLIVGYGEFTVGAQVLGRVGIGTNFAILRRAGRIAAAGTTARTLGSQRRRERRGQQNTPDRQSHLYSSVHRFTTTLSYSEATATVRR